MTINEDTMVKQDIFEFLLKLKNPLQFHIHSISVRIVGTDEKTAFDEVDRLLPEFDIDHVIRGYRRVGRYD